MIISVSSVPLFQAALDFLEKTNVGYSLSFEGYANKRECKFKIDFEKEVDSLAFKVKYADIIKNC